MNKVERDELFRRLERKTHWSEWDNLHELRDYIDRLETALRFYAKTGTSIDSGHVAREALDKGK